MSSDKSASSFKLSIKQKVELLSSYISKRLLDQIKTVSIVVVYLIIFQTLVLQITIHDALIIAIGVGVVIIGLAFFMEGLFLGLMPLGESIGIKLPQKASLFWILLFAFLLGVGVTLAEPAVGILQAAGAFVKPWEAPLLFVMLNQYSIYLVAAVGIGVGFAVLSGMLRFMFNWSLKPFIFVGITGILALTVWSQFDSNLRHVISLAWDCGAVTTGPVTVPLVLALGIGICRVVAKGDSGNSGFGVVTLASLFPIYTVLILSIYLLPQVPKPMTESEFFSSSRFSDSIRLFENTNTFRGYALVNTSFENQLQLFHGDQNLLQKWVHSLSQDTALQAAAFGPQATEKMERWCLKYGTLETRQIIFGDEDHANSKKQWYHTQKTPPIDWLGVSTANAILSIRAILPLTLFLLLVLTVLLGLMRQKIQSPDEISLGVLFALIGMFFFNVGIELGLSKLGNQVGAMLPSSFKKIELLTERQTITPFDQSHVYQAIKPDGKVEPFFYAKLNDKYQAIPYQSEAYNNSNKSYTYTPTKGPLFGSENGFGGFLLILLFAFIMGYGATLAEPALNALGITVQDLTVGTFKKNLLMQTVAIGVGIGIAVGVIKIIWNIPLTWLLLAPYFLAMVLTVFSTEDFVNIAWDSAGVTTGPVTVPLVLALGLGIGSQVNVIEGFGILAMASVYPILGVLIVGLYVNLSRKAMAGPVEK